MGGLVIADAVIALMNVERPWPVILGIIAYDTPYYGLSPSVFKVGHFLSLSSRLHLERWSCNQTILTLERLRRIR